MSDDFGAMMERLPAPQSMLIKVEGLSPLDPDAILFFRSLTDEINLRVAVAMVRAALDLGDEFGSRRLASEEGRLLDRERNNFHLVFDTELGRLDLKAAGPPLGVSLNGGPFAPLEPFFLKGIFEGSAVGLSERNKDRLILVVAGALLSGFFSGWDESIPGRGMAELSTKVIDTAYLYTERALKDVLAEWNLCARTDQHSDQIRSEIPSLPRRPDEPWRRSDHPHRKSKERRGLRPGHE